ncbi:hypothetical protein NM688_g701 [Phlebia brevispora]|uniref:Uncharacterized protein n=1 Tax=Phlebia brevispora TaxID=194682 RepID=A0ACC1TDL1_9APHY|nr:hypothetical protein NM688_g701 [Phlebia brevispora]
MTTPRHAFYENDEKLILEIFDKGVDASKVEITFKSRSFTYKNGEKTLNLEPLQGQIDPDKSAYDVRSVKVEVTFVKLVPGRWGQLVGDSPDPLTNVPSTSTAPPPEFAPPTKRAQRKNWDGITQKILEEDKSLTSDQDPNVGGDATVNEFFQKLYADADEDTRRAMLKSYTESGGTTLSTNWAEVGKAPVEVKPPEGSEWKKWGA